MLGVVDGSDDPLVGPQHGLDFCEVLALVQVGGGHLDIAAGLMAPIPDEAPVTNAKPLATWLISRSPDLAAVTGLCGRSGIGLHEPRAPFHQDLRALFAVRTFDWSLL
jgi:hypothetical protein